MNLILETERCILRELEINDLEGMYQLDSDPVVHQYLGNKPVENRDAARAIIESVQKQYTKFGLGRWAIIDKKSNDFVGWCGLKYEQKLRVEFNYYDLGYRLRHKYWGIGIGKETALASLNYGFEKLNLEEICAAAHPDNIASNKILQRIGLIARDPFEYDGNLIHWYRLSRSEWAHKV